MRREHPEPTIGKETDREYDKAPKLYLALKNNFEGIGPYDAVWLYQKERQMGKHRHWLTWPMRYYYESQLADLAQGRGGIGGDYSGQDAGSWPSSASRLFSQRSIGWRYWIISQSTWILDGCRPTCTPARIAHISRRETYIGVRSSWGNRCVRSYQDRDRPFPPSLPARHRSDCQKEGSGHLGISYAPFRYLLWSSAYG